MKTEIYNAIAVDFIEKGTTQETLYTGFVSEVGEVMIERMKEVRKGEDRSSHIVDELSDVLWYITVLAKERGYTLKDLMAANICKLELRLLNPK